MQKIISWNVASVRARADALRTFLMQEQPDLMLLQEIKATEETFPFFDMKLAGYEAVIAGQKGYNGVAILSRTPLKNVQTVLSGFADQARFVQAEWQDGIVVICVYVPNGNPPEKDPTDTSRLQYKLDWMRALATHIETLKQQGKSVILGGDFNVIERDDDVYDPELFRNSALMVQSVRQALADLKQQIPDNVIRRFNPQPHTYSFWDFQGGAWPRNHGILLDAVYVTPELSQQVADASIYREVRSWPKTSDHVPVGLILNDGM